MNYTQARTTRCGPITEELSWQERLAEYSRLNDDNKAIMSLSTNERAMIMFDLFTEHRRQIIESLPKDLSERDFKPQLYFRTYGEPLPDDYFKDEDENDG